LSVEEKLKLINSVGEEIVTIDELKKLLESNKPLIAYDGFEPSGRIHLAQGILRTINVNKMTDAGCHFKMLVADWHAWANHKLDGDMEKIKIAGEYFIEVWKACGMNLDKVEFVWASDLVKKPGYWDTVMKIAVTKNLPRIIRTVEIMGRQESESLSASQILYPLMQATDIFMLEANITQLGMDQRKVNMLAREVAEELGYEKPIVVSHHMMLGLLPPGEKNDSEDAADRSIRLKMSKSKPDSAIFMTDSVDEVKRKINNAWCPEGDIIDNPVLEYCRYIIFEKETQMTIERPEKFGGNKQYSSYQELESDFASKNLHPMDLKGALISYINKYLEPVRAHFDNNEKAKMLKDQVESFTITR
ncbi:MAG: tyrosyl-tRNA synthetase, partial [Patescibacteria group bacterium]|nr:tyrosyl-tRNA synthetase [Patescibacteria group bacterium]